VSEALRELTPEVDPAGAECGAAGKRGAGAATGVETSTACSRLDRGTSAFGGCAVSSAVSFTRCFTMRASSRSSCGTGGRPLLGGPFLCDELVGLAFFACAACRASLGRFRPSALSLPLGESFLSFAAFEAPIAACRSRAALSLRSWASRLRVSLRSCRCSFVGSGTSTVVKMQLPHSGHV